MAHGDLAGSVALKHVLPATQSDSAVSSMAMSPADLPTRKRNYREPVSGQGKEVLTRWILNAVEWRPVDFGWAGSPDPGECRGTFR